LLSFELQATTTAFIFIREHNLCSFLWFIQGFNLIDYVMHELCRRT
jgi:hypothetical protein